MKLVSRKEAKLLGLKRYYTGVPCKCGHDCERYTAKCACVECDKDKQKRKAQTPEYRESLRRAGRNYYHKNADARKKQSLAWRDNNRDAFRGHLRKYFSSVKGRARKNELSRLRYAQASHAKTAYGQEGVQEMYERAHVLGMSVDHIIPLKHPLVSGLHNIYNLQIIPLEDNMRKNNSIDLTTAKGSAREDIP